MYPGALASFAAMLALSVAAPARAAIVVDAKFDESEWENAQAFDDFVVTQPYTLAPPTHPTRVRIVGAPEGIAFAFECSHPPTTPRQKDRTPRDAFMPGDRVNVFIDFDADAQVAYNFTVGLSGAVQDGTLTNETEFSADWDGDWQYAIAETEDAWRAELLIPWSIAGMSDSRREHRTVAVLFDRVIGATQERSAAPGASFIRARFVSEFRRIEIAQFTSSALDAFPYVSVVSDQVRESIETKVGADIFWKPSGDFQLTAAINPDFGQVEADELVVNFDAIEEYVSDKRPFFTENQALFDLRTPDEGLLIYTRRIGGERDDDETRAAEIDAAIKLNGHAFGFDYGVLAAVESDYADDIGSLFYAQRLVHSGDTLSLGYLGTWVDRPFLAREALVNAIDVVWRPDDSWLVNAQVLASSIDEDDGDSDGTGGWFRASYAPGEDWEHELEATHFERDLDLDDMGYLRRADYNELEYTLTRRFGAFAADDPRGSSVWEFEPQLRWNDSGDTLPHLYNVTREAQQKSGAVTFSELILARHGIDDLISRGNGSVVVEDRLDSLGHRYQSARRGAWRYTLGARAFQEGNEDYALELETALDYFPREDLGFGVYAFPRWSRDWLIWQQDDQLASFRRHAIEAGLNANWFPAPDQEVRLKLQWLAIDAFEPTAYRIGAGGELRRSGESVAPFTVSNFGLQARYRWTFAPQSDLYVVYSRGGLIFDRPAESDGVDALLFDSLSLRDTDQFLVKVRYRF